MPSRPVVAVIVLFWLAMNGWLVYRELLPRWRAGEPPPYTIDLTEEVGANKASATTVNWNVYQKQTRVGHGFSQVARLPDRTFELRTQLRFDKFHVVPGVVGITKVASAYQVTEDGELKGLSGEVIVQESLSRGGTPAEHKFELEGPVADGVFAATFSYNKPDFAYSGIEIPVPHQSALNPLQLVNRVVGLREGRHWKIALFNPTSIDPDRAKLPAEVRELLRLYGSKSISELEAEVVADALPWGDLQVPCYRVDYRRPGEADRVAQTWVRRRDGLVLQQHASLPGFELTIQRSTSD